MRKRNYNISEFVCPTCNKTIPLPRKVSSAREHGHIKDIYCPFCKMVVKTKEVKANEYYKNMIGEIIYV